MSARTVSTLRCKTKFSTRPRLLFIWEPFRVGGGEIVMQDRALRVLQTITAKPEGQTMEYQIAGSARRYSYPVDGDVSRMRKVLRDVRQALLANPEAALVMEERERTLGGNNHAKP